jgi:sugar (pentulose or hexulose) kinase
MRYYLGIDIGTSGTKGVCFNELGQALYESNKEYDIISIKPLYAEQNPYKNHRDALQRY